MLQHANFFLELRNGVNGQVEMDLTVLLMCWHIFSLQLFKTANAHVLANYHSVLTLVIDMSAYVLSLDSEIAFTVGARERLEFTYDVMIFHYSCVSALLSTILTFILSVGTIFVPGV